MLIPFIMIGYCSIAQNSLQNIQFNNITRSEGLPNNNVNQTVTDKFGFIWVATSDGLCKYYSSGKFQIYKAKDDASEDGLRSSIISCLLADEEDNLWVGTRFGGLSRFHIPTETWKTFVYDSLNNTSISNNEVLCIKQDINGQIYVGTEDGLNIYQKETDSFKRYQHDHEDDSTLSARAVLDVLVDDKGWMWVGTWAGGLNLLVEHPSGDNSKNYFRHFQPAEKVNSHNVWSMYQDNKGRYWIGTNMGGLFIMDLPNKASNFENLQDWEPRFFDYTQDPSNPFAMQSNSILDILQDKKDRIWLATSNGIVHIEPDGIPSKIAFKHSDTIPTIKFNTHGPQFGNPSTLLENYVIDIMEDDLGILWFGTHGGISQFSWFSNQFDVHTILDNKDIFPNTQNFYVDKNNTAWIAAGELGLFIYDQNTTSYTRYNGLPKTHSTVSTIYSPDDVSLYIGTNAGIIVLNQNTGHTHNFPAPEWLKIDFDKFLFTNILLDRKNRLWIATEIGLLILDEATGIFDYFVHDPLDPTSLSDHSITDIIEDHKGNIWVSTYNGLNKLKYDQQDNIQFERFHQSNVEGGLSNDRITHLLELNKKLYIGTTNGLVELDIETEVFNELKSVGKYSIQAMLSSDDGIIWGSTTEGVFNYDINNEIFNLNEKEDGLENVSFRQNSKFIDKDGMYYFGNKSGFLKLDPNNIFSNTKIPDVYITEIKSINPKGTKLESALTTDKVILEADNYSISFNYVALNYNRAEKNKYAYKLDGFDEDWTYPESNMPAVYTNLDHGDYTFKVKASNNNGYWNEVGTSLNITIKPAIWETWWFKVLTSILAGILIFIGLHNYTKRIQRRNIELKQYNENLNKEIKQRNKIELALQSTNEELKRSNSELEQFAYIASHDLQEPLKITGSFIDLLAARYGDVLDEDAFKYIDFAKGGVGRMGLLIKNLLTFSKVGGTVLDFQEASLKHIVEEKLLDLGRLIESKNVTIDIGTLPTIICEKNQMAMLFYNLINNAIKFNENPKPVVNISSQNSFDKDYYSFYVTDNGIGIDSKHQHKIFEIFKRLHDKDAYDGTGIGLALCKKIVSRHGGKIWVESKLGKGTTFLFTISKNLGLQEEENSTVQTSLNVNA